MHDVDISIVLIVRDHDDSPNCVISALAGQVNSDAVEVLVVDGRETSCVGADMPSDLSTVVILAPGENMPRLKAIGLDAAHGAHVAFLEPNAIPQEGWLTGVRNATREDPDRCYGGAVVFGARETSINLAAYTFEYSDFSLERIRENAVPNLPGNNMVIPREILQSVCSDILEREGLNKPFCQKRLIENNLEISLRTDMSVTIKKEHRLLKFMHRRFNYGRCFGGTRLALSTPNKRLLYLVGAPFIPLILLIKHVMGLSKYDLRRLNVRSFLVLSSICILWGTGEALGYWLGRRRSCDQLY